MQHIIYKNNSNIDIDKIYNEVNKKGYSIFNIGKISKNDFLNISYLFGEVIPSGRGGKMVDDIKINNKTGTEKLPFHTDKSYWRIPPRFEILYVKNVEDMKQGEITICSLLDAYNTLSEKERKKLVDYKSKYSNPSNRDSGYNPEAKFVNIIDGKIEFFRYRLDIFSSNTPEINKMNQYINNNYKLITYKKGDILILDNWKYCAGRNNTIWGPKGKRYLYRTLVI